MDICGQIRGRLLFLQVDSSIWENLLDERHRRRAKLLRGWLTLSWSLERSERERIPIVAMVELLWDFFLVWFFTVVWCCWHIIFRASHLWWWFWNHSEFADQRPHTSKKKSAFMHFIPHGYPKTTTRELYRDIAPICLRQCIYMAVHGRVDMSAVQPTREGGGVKDHATARESHRRPEQPTLIDRKGPSSWTGPGATTWTQSPILSRQPSTAGVLVAGRVRGIQR